MSARAPKLAAKVMEKEHAQHLADKRSAKKRRITYDDEVSNGGSSSGPPPTLMSSPESPAPPPPPPAFTNSRAGPSAPQRTLIGDWSDDDGFEGFEEDYCSDFDVVAAPFDAAIDWPAWERRCNLWRVFNSVFEQSSLPIHLRTVCPFELIALEQGGRALHP